MVGGMGGQRWLSEVFRSPFPDLRARPEMSVSYFTNRATLCSCQRRAVVIMCDNHGVPWYPWCGTLQLALPELDKVEESYEQLENVIPCYSGTITSEWALEILAAPGQAPEHYFRQIEPST